MPSLYTRVLEALLGPDHVSYRTVERELWQALRDSLRTLGPAAAIIYVVTAAFLLTVDDPFAIMLSLGALAVATMLTFIGMVGWMDKVPVERAEAVTLGIFALFTIYAMFLTNLLFAEMRPALFAIILVASSALFVTPRWYLAGVIVVSSGWAVAWLIHPEPALPAVQATIVALSAFVGSVGLFMARRQALARAVSERYAAEDRAWALSNANVRLAEARSELEETLEEVEVRNEDLQRFAYVVSHDLREPVRMVRNYIKLIQRRAGDKFTEEEQEFFDFATDGARRLDDMIQGILKFSRVSTHGSEPEPMDADDALDDALSNLRMRVDETGAEVTREPLPTVVADPTQLTQVFQNLLANALKYHREGVPPRVRVSATTEDGDIVFHVEDNGQGIPPGDLDDLFQLFNRGSQTGHGEGQGLGLAVVKRIVERHDGKVWVESAEGEGSTFHFSLPQPSREDGGEAPEAPGEPGEAPA